MSNRNGFTLIEMMTTVAIIAILAGIAIPTYLHFRTKAFAADIISTHEELQEVVYAEALSLTTNDCEEIANHISNKYFTGHAADLHFGTVTIPGGKGYRPVLLVHALKNVNGGTGVKAARIAYDEFDSENIIDPDTTSTVTKDEVAYSVDLIQGDTPICTQHPLLASVSPAPPQTPEVTPPTMPSAPPPSAAPVPSSSQTQPPPAPASSQPAFDQSKPASKDNNPCPDGKILTSKKGTPFDGTPDTGQCVDSPQKASLDPDYDPYGDTKCQACSGPPMICERLHHDATCTWPDNICINKLTNHDTGAREVVRRCGNADEAIHEWYQGTSDNDRCTTFNPKFVQTLDFECTFACVTDNCNEWINPTFGNSDDKNLRIMYIPPSSGK